MTSSGTVPYLEPDESTLNLEYNLPVVEVLSVAFAPHKDVSKASGLGSTSEVVATGMSDGAVLLWKVDPEAGSRTFQTLLEVSKDGSPVNAMSFSPDGHVLCVGREGGLNMWNYENRLMWGVLPCTEGGLTPMTHLTYSVVLMVLFFMLPLCF